MDLLSVRRELLFQVLQDAARTGKLVSLYRRAEGTVYAAYMHLVAATCMPFSQHSGMLSMSSCCTP